MGPIWGRQDPDGPHIDPMNFAISESNHFGTPKAVNMITKLSSSQLLVFSQNYIPGIRHMLQAFSWFHGFGWFCLVDFTHILQGYFTGTDEIISSHSASEATLKMGK